MSQQIPPRAFHLFAVFTASAVWLLIGLGGLVTSHGAGMTVPDWPTSYGYNMFLLPVRFWQGGAFFEHSHRLLAAGIGLLTTILVLWAWCRETSGGRRTAAIITVVVLVALLGNRDPEFFKYFGVLMFLLLIIGIVNLVRTGGSLRWMCMTALFAVILQGILGGMRVVLFKDELGIFHATLAQLFLVLIALIALVSSRWWRNRRVGDPARSGFARQTGRLALITTVLILLQLVIGATMRHEHAGLAVPDFPLAYGQVWPDTDPAFLEQVNRARLDTREFNPITATHVHVHMTHRIVAFVILALVAWVSVRVLRDSDSSRGERRLAKVWMFLVAMQFVLGVVTVLKNKPADIATGHVLVGALLLVTGALLTVMKFQFSVAAEKSLMQSPARATINPDPDSLQTV